MYYLNNSTQEKSWGPFPTRERAWLYLFGRCPETQEIEKYEECGWSVDYNRCKYTNCLERK